MRKVKVCLYLNVADDISDDDIEEYFEENEEDMQEHFMEMQYGDNDGIYINKISIHTEK